MLEVVNMKNVYTSLSEDNINELRQENHPDGSYDAAICVGTFPLKHVGVKGLLEVVRIVNPKGVICFTLRDDFVNDSSNGFNDQLTALASFPIKTFWHFLRCWYLIQRKAYLQNRTFALMQCHVRDAQANPDKTPLKP